MNRIVDIGALDKGLRTSADAAAKHDWTIRCTTTSLLCSKKCEALPSAQTTTQHWQRHQENNTKSEQS